MKMEIEKVDRIERTEKMELEMYNQNSIWESNSQPKSEFDERFKRVVKLGVGSYGVVYLYKQTKPFKMSLINRFFLGEKKNQSDYFAVKVYKKPDNNRDGIDFSSLREINLLQSLDHPNLANCYQVFTKREELSTRVYVVMDFNLELEDLLKHKQVANDSRQLTRVCLQLLRGLHYMHSNFVFHRDLKPENIFVSRSGFIKIADFGFAKEFGTPYKKYTTNTCTREYRAPEIFLGSNSYTFKADVWSLGCIFAFLFTSKPLFVSETGNEIDLLAKMFYLRGTPTQDNWPSSEQFPRFYHFHHEDAKDLSLQLQLPEQPADLISQCLRLDPRKRPTTAQLLQHPIFSQVNQKPFGDEADELFWDKIDKICHSKEK